MTGSRTGTGFQNQEPTEEYAVGVARAFIRALVLRASRPAVVALPMPCPEHLAGGYAHRGATYVDGKPPAIRPDPLPIATARYVPRR